MQKRFRQRYRVYVSKSIAKITAELMSTLTPLSVTLCSKVEVDGQTHVPSPRHLFARLDENNSISNCALKYYDVPSLRLDPPQSILGKTSGAWDSIECWMLLLKDVINQQPVSASQNKIQLEKWNFGEMDPPAKSSYFRWFVCLRSYLWF